MESKIKYFKVLETPEKPEPNAIYFIKMANKTVDAYVTDKEGVLHRLNTVQEVEHIVTLESRLFPEELKLHTVIIEGTPENKLQAVKLIKQMLNISLRDAKQMVDYTPSEIVSNVSLEQAKDIVSKFTRIGTIATIT